ncbi:MAG: hypothetical protein LBU25_10430, partial [Treponema sp.]|nr:hypothetical protein [Treponema sp.]
MLILVYRIVFPVKLGYQYTRYLTGGEGLWEDQGMNMEDLQETAGLAHLTMNDQELAAAFPAFEQMLGFFAAMQAADEDLGAFPACPARFSGP